MITIDDFVKVEMRVGTVLSAEAVEGSEKLIKQTVDFGELGEKQILSGIRKWYKPESLIGKQFIYCINLEPRLMMGLESQGMIIAVDSDEHSFSSNKPILVKPSKKVPSGSRVR
jgi:methionine--tRNA ligase beta chain